MSTLSSHEIWLAFQLCDSSYGGALAHSAGVESAFKHGIISKSVDSMIKYILLVIDQSCHLFIPVIKQSFDCALSYVETSQVSNNSQVLCLNEANRIDTLTHAMITNEVSRRASLNQGRCFLRIAIEAFGNDVSLLQEIQVFIQNNLTSFDNSKASTSQSIDQSHGFHGHYPLIFGLTCGLLHLSYIMTVRIYLRILVRDMINACTRLGLMGPLTGARVQADLRKRLEDKCQSIISGFERRVPFDNCQMISSGVETSNSSNYDDTHEECTITDKNVQSHNRIICSDNSSISGSVITTGHTDNEKLIDNKRIHSNVDDNTRSNSSKKCKTTDDSLIRFDSSITSQHDDDDVQEPKQCNPFLEMIQSRHDLLYSRLFNS